MAYGTPATPDEVEAYYTHVRRGRPPTPEQLDDLRRRYHAIGGTSPLLERTRSQAAGLQGALGDAYTVELGMKHSTPFLEEGAESLAERGVKRAVGLVLAPHFSVLSVGEYAERVRKAEPVATGTLAVTFVESWHLAPGYVSLLAHFVADAIATLDPGDIEVVFTAHSLPTRILDLGDPYPDQLRETAAAVAALAEIPRWRVAWQSAGRTREPWLGPDILTVLPELAESGRHGVVVCPAGFVSDHLEILYDLDIEARGVAEGLGLAFARTAAPNDHPAFCATLADVVTQHLAPGLG